MIENFVTLTRKIREFFQTSLPFFSLLSALFSTPQVIPKTIYLSVGLIQVKEGAHTTVTPSVVTVLTDYYTDKIRQYLVAVQPTAGQLELSSRRGRRVEAFTPEQLKQGLISVGQEEEEEEKRERKKKLRENVVVVEVGSR